MIVAVNRIFVKPAYRDAFEERFKTRVRLVESMPGFVRMEILRPVEGEDYLVMTWWKDRESFEAWVQSEAFRKGHARGASHEWFSQPNVFALYEVMDSTP